jgi:hypothetical protein
MCALSESSDVPNSNYQTRYGTNTRQNIEAGRRQASRTDRRRPPDIAPGPGGGKGGYDEFHGGFPADFGRRRRVPGRSTSPMRIPNWFWPGLTNRPAIRRASSPSPTIVRCREGWRSAGAPSSSTGSTTLLMGLTTLRTSLGRPRAAAAPRCSSRRVAARPMASSRSTSNRVQPSDSPCSARLPPTSSRQLLSLPVLSFRPMSPSRPRALCSASR